METKYNKISIKAYLDLRELLKEYRGTHEENRLFALKHEKLLTSPKKLLLRWTERHLFHLRTPLESEIFVKHFLPFQNLLTLLSLLFGFMAGFGLLSYSGNAPVNIIYYLLFSMLLPLMGILLSLLSMVSRGEFSNLFRLFFPLSWIEKITNLFSSFETTTRQDVLFPSDLKKWMFMSRLQLFSSLFSVGLFLALLLMVSAQDIAFSWSTTLNITPLDFHKILTYIAKPWEMLLPSAVPSVELVELSQYYRLGEHLNPEMVKNADKLGAWWQFLAMVTLLYAICSRLLFFIVSQLLLKKQLEREFLSTEGVDRLLKEFETPYVSTEAIKVEKYLDITEESNHQVKVAVRRAYNNIIGWNFSKDEIVLLNDSKEIRGVSVSTVGGSHTFKEDQEVAKSVCRTALLYVKSWEPPTMDFVDFLELLIENSKVDEIQLYPIGTVGRYYESDAKEIAVWKRKIQGLNSKKVWVIDAA